MVDSRKGVHGASHGWITLKLVDISNPDDKLPQYFFYTVLTSCRMWKIKEKIKERYGSIEKIHLYNKDPTEYWRIKAVKDRMEQNSNLEKEKQQKEKEKEDQFEETEDEDALKIDAREVEKAIKAKQKTAVYNELLRSGSYRESIDEMIARLNFKQFDQVKGSESLTVCEIFGTRGVEFKKQLPENMEQVKNEDQYLIFFDYWYNEKMSNRRNRLTALTTRHLDTFVDPLIRL